MRYDHIFIRVYDELRGICQDPIIRKRILQLAVAFSTTALDKKVTFMLKVLEHILMSRPVEQPEYSAYNDAVKELQTDGMYELQRLASKMPDQLLVSLILRIEMLDVNKNFRMFMTNWKPKSTRLFLRVR